MVPTRPSRVIGANSRCTSRGHHSCRCRNDFGPGPGGRRELAIRNEGQFRCITVTGPLLIRCRIPARNGARTCALSSHVASERNEAPDGEPALTLLAPFPLLSTIPRNNSMFGLTLAACLLLVGCGGDTPPGLVDTTKGGSGTVTLIGTVTDANLRPVNGGVVEILAGSTRLRTADVSTGGSFSVGSLAAGTYTIRLHPPLTYSLGPSEPDERTLTISAGSTPQPMSFVVQSALWADDFQSYTSLAQIIAFCNGTQRSGDFFFGSARDGNCVHTDNMAFDLTGGPNGSKALRYDFPARPAGTSNYTIALQPRLNPIQAAGSSELWVRFTDRLSPNFRIGGAGCGGASCEYKYLFLDMLIPGQGVGTFTFELDSQQGGAP